MAGKIKGTHAWYDYPRWASMANVKHIGLSWQNSTT